MSAFKDSIMKGLTLGENGHACLTAEGLGNPLLALFDRLFQGIDEIGLRDGLRTILDEARRSESTELVADVFVLAFSARWCRGGKGAKLAFYQCLKMLYEDFPTVVLRLLPLVPQFGYWKDFLLLLQEVWDHPVPGVDYSPLNQEVWRLYAKQLEADYALLEACRADGSKPSISFAGKYAPREKKQFAKSLHAVSELAQLMFPPLGSDVVVIGDSTDKGTREATTRPNKKRYREVVSALAAALDVPEVKMCAHRFADINMAGVPSRCMKIHSKAFANEIADKLPSASEESTGNRFPEDMDRVMARRHLVETLGSKGVKGGQVYPHEFVAKVSAGKPLSVTDRLTVSAQWASMRDSISKMVSDRIALKGGAAGMAALGKLVPLCDVSGSMSGQPMDVSIGLGILCSELTHPAFRDLVLCFSRDAQWHSLAACSTIVEKVQTLRAAPWGMNTDFYKAMQRILTVVEDNDLQQEDVPNLLVISDMQFDAAGGHGWNTVYENIENMFRESGLRKNGCPITPPTIVFWNVRGAIGFPVASNQRGVVMLSGFSPALLKFVLSGELEREEEVVEVEMAADETGEGMGAEPVIKKVKRQVTPEEAMHTALHEDSYEPIREILRDCGSMLRVGACPLSRSYVRTATESTSPADEASGVNKRRRTAPTERGGAGRGRGRAGGRLAVPSMRRGRGRGRF